MLTDNEIDALASQILSKATGSRPGLFESIKWTAES